jgi:hypothetical protein
MDFPREIDAGLVRLTTLVSRPGTVCMLGLVLDELRDVPGEEVATARGLVATLRDAFLEEARGVEQIRGEAAPPPIDEETS